METVDISKKAIALANRNVELNFGIEASHRGVVADVLEYLNPAAQSGVGQGRFDFIILDPPAAMAGREVRIVRSLPHAADHPVSIYHPEGEYLKGLLLEVE